MDNKIFAPGEIRKEYNEVLRKIKLELQRILRDNGKCLSFSISSHGKKTWMEFPAVKDYALVYSSGDIFRSELIGTGENKRPNFRPGKDKSVFDPAANISMYDLLDFIDLYPKNPFSE